MAHTYNLCCAIIFDKEELDHRGRWVGTTNSIIIQPVPASEYHKNAKNVPVRPQRSIQFKGRGIRGLLSICL